MQAQYGALAADQLSLDDGDAQPARSQRRSAVLAGRAAAENDDVVVAHVGSSVPDLLRHHVRGVPVGPVRVSLSGALLVLAVGGLRAPHRVRQVAGGAERSRGGVDAPGKPGRDLLQQPAVAVGIAERGEREVAAMLGIRTADRAVRAEVEDLAHLDAGRDELVPGGLDVGDDQVPLWPNRARPT